MKLPKLSITRIVIFVRGKSINFEGSFMKIDEDYNLCNGKLGQFQIFPWRLSYLAFWNGLATKESLIPTLEMHFSCANALIFLTLDEIDISCLVKFLLTWNNSYLSP